MFLVTAGEMRAFDAAAIERYGIPGVVLMENAGRTTFKILQTYLEDDVRCVKVVVVAGPGNNGGDGYVIARYLINHGADVQTFLLTPREKIKGDALINLQVLEKMTSRIFPVHDETSLAHAARTWHEADVIVDAILGTGLTSEVRSPFREAIEWINDAPGLKLAVDLPSGLDADTGRIMGVAVKADLTATYGFRKLGSVLHPGVELCGTVEVVDISIPLPAIEENPPKARLYDRLKALPPALQRTEPEAHKGTFGHVLVLGGSPGKSGAPAMAAMAAARIGAGLVTVGVPASLNSILEVKLTEEMTEPLPESIPGYLGEQSIGRVLSLSQDKECIVLGPGLSTREGVGDLVSAILAGYYGWLVVDADGLNALVGRMEKLRTARAKVVLTPHPGEMGRLYGVLSKAVQEDRIGTARRVAQENGVWVVLKGARTITAFPDGRIVVNPSGNPWMASGGQGDALSGILGGLLAQGIAPEEAIPLGVYLHGLAADMIVERRGPAPVLATDVIAEIPALLGTFKTAQAY
ncbi:MAG: NAD(P)H-hydrate dehydratase [Desulfomonile sp.]|nr:NAD(P)H-hydrate dehydratase [Desulfomonile sp.]